MAEEPKRVARKRSRKTKISDLERQISILLDTGKVLIGTRQGTKEILLGKAKALIYANNIPEQSREDILHYAELSGVKAIEYPGTSLALGKLCGKLFPVSILVVQDQGEAELG